MPLINFEINFVLTWYADCVISSPTGATKFSITDTAVIALSTQYNAKLLQQLKLGFQRTTN